MCKFYTYICTVKQMNIFQYNQTMEATEVIYNIKKCIKHIKSDDVDMNTIVTGLLKVRHYLYCISRKPLGDELREISRSLVRNMMDPGMAILRLRAVISELRKVREKNCVMRQRMRYAEMCFSNEERCKKKRNWGCSKVDSLSRYDVIYAPTQGGFHFCIVSDVFDGDHVIAYPMTTASKENLRAVGCRSYSLKGIEGKHSCTSLTSAATMIPYKAALRSYVERMPVSPELERALSYVQCS